MRGTLSELHRRATDVQRKGWTNNFIHFLIDTLWHDESKDIYVTGVSYNSETHILTLTRNNGLPALTHVMVGIDGARGSVTRSGSTIPYPFTPAWEGDYYLDTDTYQLFGPIDGTGLASSIYIKGADGATGTDGQAGADGVAGDDGREIELRENAGWIEQRYVGDVLWTQIYQLSGSDTSIKVSIDFVDANVLEFVYNCPVAMVFTSQDSEGADAVISPALNTNMSQYGKVTVTAPGVGLIVLNGNTL